MVASVSKTSIKSIVYMASSMQSAKLFWASKPKKLNKINKKAARKGSFFVTNLLYKSRDKPCVDDRPALNGFFGVLRAHWLRSRASLSLSTCPKYYICESQRSNLKWREAPTISPLRSTMSAVTVSISCS